MRKANGPEKSNKNKNCVTHLMTMPQAAGKKMFMVVLEKDVLGLLYEISVIPGTNHQWLLQISMRLPFLTLSFYLLKMILIVLELVLLANSDQFANYLLCLDLFCQIKSVKFAKSICSGMD